MSDLMTVELSARQRELLLRGLRFVRSSRMLQFRESSDLTEEQCEQELKEVRMLSELLAGTRERERSSV